jgi:hypothetical protein
MLAMSLTLFSEFYEQHKDDDFPTVRRQRRPKSQLQAIVDAYLAQHVMVFRILEEWREKVAPHQYCDRAPRRQQKANHVVCC